MHTVAAVRIQRNWKAYRMKCFIRALGNGKKNIAATLLQRYMRGYVFVAKRRKELAVALIKANDRFFDIYRRRIKTTMAI